MRADAGFATLHSEAPVSRQAVTAACAPYTRFTVALPAPRVAPGSLLPRTRRQRALWITPAAWEPKTKTQFCLLLKHLVLLCFYCQVINYKHAGRCSYKAICFSFISFTSLPYFELISFRSNHSRFILLFWFTPPCALSLTCAGVGGVERQGWVTVVTVATALAPAPDSVVPAVITNTSAGAAGGKPRSLREVTTICVAVALALWCHRGVWCHSNGRDETKWGHQDESLAYLWIYCRQNTFQPVLTSKMKHHES